MTHFLLLSFLPVPYFPSFRPSFPFPPSFLTLPSFLSFQVLRPLRECGDADAKWGDVPHCATWSDLDSSVAVKVRGFPERDLAGDLTATINKAFPVAIEVLDCAEGGDDPALLCASVSRAGGSLEDLTFGY